MEIIKQVASTYTPPDTAIIHKTRANVTSRNDIPPPIRLVQYDKSLPILEVSLLNGSIKYEVPSGAAVNIRVRKTDGTCVYNPALGISADRHTAYISITRQMTAVAGDIQAVLEIVLSNSIAGTALIPIIIDRNPVSDDAIESADEYKTIQELIYDAQQAAQNSANSANAAKKSETAAKASENAAKASQTSAANSASSAISSKNSAESAKTAAVAAQQEAKESEVKAKDSEIAAKKSEDCATIYAQSAEYSATEAKKSEVASKDSEANALAYKLSAGQSENSALNYAELTKSLYEALLGTELSTYEPTDPILDSTNGPIMDTDGKIITERSVHTGQLIGYEVTELLADSQGESVLDNVGDIIEARWALADGASVTALRSSIARLESLITDTLIKMDSLNRYSIFDNRYNGGKA